MKVHTVSVRHQSPTSGTEGLVHNSTILDFWEVDHTFGEGGGGGGGGERLPYLNT